MSEKHIKTPSPPQMKKLLPSQKEKILSCLREIVGTSQLSSKAEDLEVYGSDWSKLIPSDPLALVFPKSTLEVSKLLKFCSEHKISVVPSGGRTGLAGGAIAGHGELIISLEKMNQIISLDPVALSIEAEAGVVLENLQEAARQKGLEFPLDLGAKGSCQIGGNIATNAGGLKMIRHGGTREQVLGLEVVLADGSILDLNRKLLKNNTGYDLKQWFIGSEGTLGIITKASLKLSPSLQDSSLICASLNDLKAISKILNYCHQNSLRICAFEFFTKKALHCVLEHNKNLSSPFSSDCEFYFLLELEKSKEKSEDDFWLPFFTDLGETILEDGVIASSHEQRKNLWALRENITESLQALGQVHKNDITVPVSSLSDFILELEKKILAKERKSSFEIILFGHIGDGNIHLNYLDQDCRNKESFIKKVSTLEKEVFTLVAKFAGSISAEHGVGILKKEHLHFSRSPEEISLMKGLKKMLDPKGILNPGKIFLACQ